MYKFDGVTKKLCAIFSSRAAKPAREMTPEEIKAAQRREKIRKIEKNAIRNHPLLWTARTFSKLALAFYAVAGTTSAVVLNAPRLMGPTFDEYMKEKGYSGTLAKDYYDNPNIRVYTNNKLIPFQHAGFAVKSYVADLDETSETKIDYARGLIYVPIIYAGEFISSFAQTAGKPTPYAINTDLMTGLEGQGSFIYPPQENFNLRSFITMIVPDAADKELLENANTPSEKLDKLFIQFVMLHEARHCDQVIGMETDADQYALKVLAREGAAPEALEELRIMVRSLRSMAAILSTDDDHSTTSLSAENPRSRIQSIEDPASFAQARQLLKHTVMNNADVLNGLSISSAYYYSSLRLIQNPDIQRNGPVYRALTSYMLSCSYLNDWCGKGFIERNDFTLSDININFLYAPENLRPSKLDRLNDHKSQPEIRPLPADNPAPAGLQWSSSRR